MKKKDDQASEAGGIILFREDLIHAKSVAHSCMGCGISTPGAFAIFSAFGQYPSVETLPAFTFDFQLRNYQITHLPNSRIVVSQMIAWSILRLWKASWTKDLLTRT